MEELLKYAIESGSFGVSLFLAYVLFKKFVTKEIVEPIQELKLENTELKKSFTQFTERVTGFVFRITKDHGELMESVNRDVATMNGLFTETTRQTSQARLEAAEALKKVNTLEQTADKMLKILSLVHDKSKKIETEVQKINEDLIMVKTKVSAAKSED